MVLHELVEETMTACQIIKRLSNADDTSSQLSNAHNLLKIPASFWLARHFADDLGMPIKSRAKMQFGLSPLASMELLAKE